ncbi:MAG: hypothetical protein WC975_05750 [Phycisphaerae bacterium]
MMKSGKYVLWVLLLTALASCTGCQMFIAKRLLQEVRGGQSQLTIIKNASPSALIDYKRIKMGDFRNEMGRQFPSYAATEVRQAFIDQIVKNPRIYDLASENSNARSMLIMRGSIIHYQPTSAISGVMGGFSQLICRVELIDAATGKIIGVANCCGFSKAIARSGVKELAAGAAKAMRKWLTKQSAEGQ